MRVAVVYESLFGNTGQVAEAIADGIRSADPDARVSVAPVTTRGPRIPRIDLVVAGGPTHFLGMTSPRSRRMRDDGRESGTQDHGEPQECRGIREWLDALPRGRGTGAAAFDTRLGTLFPGSAARLIGGRLVNRGYQLVARPEGFLVENSRGPLLEGERERARDWGESLVSGLVHDRQVQEAARGHAGLTRVSAPRRWLPERVAPSPATIGPPDRPLPARAVRRDEGGGERPRVHTMTRGLAWPGTTVVPGISSARRGDKPSGSPGRH